MERFKPHPITRPGEWTSNYVRYHKQVHEVLAELEGICLDLASRRPANADHRLSGAEITPEVRGMYRLRDRTADMVKLYAALTIESFLNLYGVIRLGRAYHKELEIERKPMPAKLRYLLLLCDELAIGADDEILACMMRVVSSRNNLAHPKAHDLDSNEGQKAAQGEAIPETARKIVADLEQFFRLLDCALPDTADFRRQIMSESEQ